MFTSDQYELLDFGAGRKLERFGQCLLDRPAPAAEDASPQTSTLWNSVTASYERTSNDQGRWNQSGELPQQWVIRHDHLQFELKATDSGHVGVFVEQAANWDWIARRVGHSDRPLRVLNLFAYTGGSTLAAAAAGAHVVHVDAAKSAVAWARRNAIGSGLADAPIRWMVDDAAAFVRREIRRGRQYDAVILDPPSYGRGPKGQTWKLSKDLLNLLQGCAQLTTDHRAFFLLTCHTTGFGPADAEACMAEGVFGSCQAGASATKMYLRTRDGRRLYSGVVARWPPS